MQELIRRSLALWRQASHPGAGDEEIARCLALVPALCSELEECRKRRARRDTADAQARREELGRLSRQFAHEIRNRGNVVELSLKRAALLAGDDRVRTALEPVRRSFRHLEALVEDLGVAVAAPVRAGGCKRGAPLPTVVRDVFATYRVVADDRDVRLESDDELPEVEVDAARVELILANLLSNALRHADPAKGARWVRVEARVAEADGDGEARRPGSLRFAVLDNGVGIPEERLPGLFDEPAPDGDGHPARRGMGLSIVRQAVERSGGRVWIESRESEGTRVHFTFPCRTAATPSRSAPAAEPPRRAVGQHRSTC